MNAGKLVLTVWLGLFLTACGGGGGSTATTASAPGAPTGVKVAAGATVGTTALVSFTAPASNGGRAITGYTVTVTPGGITATGTASPIALTGLTAGTAYTFSVVATNSVGNSAASTITNINNYNVVETFLEPETTPNNSIFTGSFTYDSISQTVTNLTGALTESMTSPMATVSLTHQLSSAPATLGGVNGLLVTTFLLNTTNTLWTGLGGNGWDPGTGSGLYYGFPGANPGNAYAMIFVNTTDPTTALAQVQIDKLAYADCTANGMMGSTCMTGTTVAGYGTVGTMYGYPISQVITKQ